MTKKMFYQTKMTMDDLELTLYKTDKGLALISASTDQPSDFSARWLRKYFKDYQPISNRKVFEKEIEEIKDYFAGELKAFTFPFDLYGTEFQQTVWKNLLKIPYGETMSYSELATLMGQPKAVRAVSRAIGQNPLLIIVPCHRVIGKNQQLTGFRSGLALKQELINLEQLNK